MIEPLNTGLSALVFLVSEPAPSEAKGSLCGEMVLCS